MITWQIIVFKSSKTRWQTNMLVSVQGRERKMTALNLYRKYEALNYLAVKHTPRHAEAVVFGNLLEIFFSRFLSTYSYFTVLWEYIFKCSWYIGTAPLPIMPGVLSFMQGAPLRACSWMPLYYFASKYTHRHWEAACFKNFLEFLAALWTAFKIDTVRLHQAGLYGNCATVLGSYIISTTGHSHNTVHNAVLLRCQISEVLWRPEGWAGLKFRCCSKSRHWMHRCLSHCTTRGRFRNEWAVLQSLKHQIWCKRSRCNLLKLLNTLLSLSCLSTLTCILEPGYGYSSTRPFNRNKYASGKLVACSVTQQLARGNTSLELEYLLMDPKMHRSCSIIHIFFVLCLVLFPNSSSVAQSCCMCTAPWPASTYIWVIWLQTPLS